MNKNIFCRIALIPILFVMGSCSDDFLKPEPQSFYAAENVLINKSGMDALLTTCEDLLREEYTIPYIRFEFMSSEIAVCAGCNVGDIEANLYPSSGNLSSAWYNVKQYWESWYKVIKYANTAIGRIDDATFENDGEKNAILAKAMFYRSRAYYRLTHQFGDVPLILEEVQSPRLDFYTFTRESILRKMKDDLDEFIPFLPLTAPNGTVNRDAAYHLLTKINLALGEFDDAITSASAVINGGTHSLMTTRFGAFANQAKITEGYRALVNNGEVALDVIWDLHRAENITASDNKEVLYAIVDRPSVVGNDDQNVPSWNINFKSGMRNMRNSTPRWTANGQIKTPSGAKGMQAGDEPLNQYRTLGHGEGYLRSNDWLNYGIWDDPNDLRGKQPNFWRMTDLVYNNTALIGTADEIYYGKHVTASSRPPGIDSIRTWSGFFNKFLNDDDRATPNGSNQDWYVYRVAETYLLRAEAYYWKGDLPNAAADINAIRARANAGPLSPGVITIATILDERAKELFKEEPRKTELARISYLFALTGKSYNGKTYTLANFSSDNFFYDRIMEKNLFYKNQIQSDGGPKYKIAPRNILWPIPESVIIANSQGLINQTAGYVGSESNVAPRVYPADYVVQ